MFFEDMSCSGGSVRKADYHMGMNNRLSTSLLPKERRQLQDRGPNPPDERDANDQPGDEKVDDVVL